MFFRFLGGEINISLILQRKNLSPSVFVVEDDDRLAMIVRAFHGCDTKRRSRLDDHRSTGLGSLAKCKQSQHEDRRPSMIEGDRMGIGEAARQLIRAAALGSLATVMRETQGAPYASLVAVATDHDGSPVLLLSDLADHTKNLIEDDRVSLLLTSASDQEDPMAGERLSLQGRLVRSDATDLRRRYLTRHPSAALYADFADFGIYRMTIDRGHLVAGFGQIHWIEGKALTIAPSEALVAAETDIIDHMNDDHTDALELYATRLLAQAGGAWRMTGVDGEGADLRLGETVLRLPFGHQVENSTDVRNTLITLVNKARNA